MTEKTECVDVEKAVNSETTEPPVTAESAEVAVQCNLLKGCLRPRFSIDEVNPRRKLVRRIFGLLIFQNAVVIVCMELFLHRDTVEINHLSYTITMLLMFAIYLAIYFLGEHRRRPPLNYIFFVMVTALYNTDSVIYAKMVGSRLAFLQPSCLIVQLLLLTIYSKQRFFRFTNFRGVAIILFVSLLGLITIIFWSTETITPILFKTLFVGCYIIYDTQIMLTGQHGYQLEANEYFFATTNIYADWAIFFWRFFKFIFLEHFITIVKFFAVCCKAEVC